MERSFVKSKVEVAQWQYHGERREIKENCVSVYLCLGQIQEASLILHYQLPSPLQFLLNDVPVSAALRQSSHS